MPAGGKPVIAPPNTGLRRQINLDGERYYLVVTNGPDGLRVDVGSIGDSPVRSRTAWAVETMARHIDALIAEVQHGAT